jgi:tetratricopeptide (TPR) repeat protein
MAMRAAVAAILLCACAACGDATSQWIDAARAANAHADAFTAVGDRDHAIEALEALVSRRPPAAVAGQDVRTVLQDAYGRLAELALRGGRADAALRYADAGLQLGDGRDLFTSALRTRRGHALEALARDTEAAREYENAQEILEALLQQAIGDGGAR